MVNEILIHKINHKPQGTAEGVAVLMSDPAALTLERNATAANERVGRGRLLSTPNSCATCVLAWCAHASKRALLIMFYARVASAACSLSQLIEHDCAISTKKRVNEQRSNALCLGTKQPPPSSSNIRETGSEANNVIMLSLSLNKSILQRNQNNASSSEFELQNAILQRTQF